MRRAAALLFLVLIAPGCATDPRAAFEPASSETPGTVRIAADRCAAFIDESDAPLSRVSSSTRLRHIEDMRPDPTQLGVMRHPTRPSPVPLFPDPHDPIEVALARRVARDLASPLLPDLVVADITLDQAWVEAQPGGIEASFVFTVTPIMLGGRAASVEFSGRASARNGSTRIARSEAVLQAAFCDAIAHFDAWLGGRSAD